MAQLLESLTNVEHSPRVAPSMDREDPSPLRRALSFYFASPRKLPPPSPKTPFSAEAHSAAFAALEG